MVGAPGKLCGWVDGERQNMYSRSVHVGLGAFEMPTVTTYTQARATLATLCDEVSATREPIIIRRRNADDVAIVSADELESLMETAHLLRSPKNAERLLSALSRAQNRDLPPSSIKDLRREIGIGEE